jgi:hypothetical protein
LGLEAATVDASMVFGENPYLYWQYIDTNLRGYVLAGGTPMVNSTISYHSGPVTGTTEDLFATLGHFSCFSA